MRRPTTMVFAAGWTGFLVVSATMGSLAIGNLAYGVAPAAFGLGPQVEAMAASIRAGGNMDVLVTIAAVVSAAATAAFLVLAAWLIQSADPEDRVVGERLMLMSLGTVGALVAAAHFGGFNAYVAAGPLWGFEAIVGLSMLSVLFDRTIEADATGEREHDIDALILIGRQMARSALRLPPPDRRDDGDR